LFALINRNERKREKASAVVCCQTDYLEMIADHDLYMIEQDSKAQELKSDKFAKKVDEAAEVIRLCFLVKKKVFFV
jgi:hypothetical protein